MTEAQLQIDTGPANLMMMELNTMRIAIMFTLLACSLPALAEQAAPESGVEAKVQQCYERLQQRVPKRTSYGDVSATPEQLQSGVVAHWDKRFSDRIAMKVETKVNLAGTVSDAGKQHPVKLVCGYNGDKIVTWEVRNPNKG